MRLYDKGRQPFRPVGHIQTQQDSSGPKQKSPPEHRHFTADLMVMTKEKKKVFG